jgi:hypothetical protein
MDWTVGQKNERIAQVKILDCYDRINVAKTLIHFIS